MPTPNELVTEAFAQAQNYASTAQSQLASFTNALNAAVQNAPLLDVTFAPIPDPGAAAAPTSAPVYVEPAPYSDSTLTALQSAINERMNGGTGLPAAVEQQIWDRARERELATLQAAVDQASYDAEALGFALPPGVLADGIRRETRAYYDRLSALSRDIAVKQAELEQSNLQKIFDQAVSFQGILADIRFKTSQVAVDTYRAGLEGYKADILRFQAEVDQDVKHWEVAIRQYEATMTYTINGQKLNAEIVRANLSANLEAAKVGAQVYAQLTASAYSMIHASAGVSAGGTTSVSYSYANDTSSTVPPLTSI